MLDRGRARAAERERLTKQLDHRLRRSLAGVADLQRIALDQAPSREVRPLSSTICCTPIGSLVKLRRSKLGVGATGGWISTGSITESGGANSR